MWKGPIIPMDTNYPFGAITDQNAPKHLVRKKIPKNDKFIEKAQILASLKHECLIKLQSACEEGGENYLLFQYVPTSLQKWYGSVSREFIQNYEQRLILFSRYIADKGIITTFRRENMGASSIGDAKYYLDLTIQINPNVDKMGLKKKYKEEIKELMQYYLDKKNSQKNTVSNKVQVPEKKQNSKILKILQAIEKGKANLCADNNKQLLRQPPKQTSQTLIVQQNAIIDNKATLKPIKNIQNVIIQREINKVNKIQVMVNNKPVEFLQHEIKRQFASSSFYINGMPAVVLQRQGQARRLLSPNQKLSRFEEVKYKEYKSMKTSGEHYVQDFINVLQADDTDKITLPGSPRGTLSHHSKMALQGSPRNTMLSPPKSITTQANSLHFAIEQEKQTNGKPKQQNKKIPEDQRKKIVSPKHGRSSTERMAGTEKQIKAQNQGNLSKTVNNIVESKLGNSNVNKTNQLQKKVSEAIANSLNAINKFKSAKNQLNP